MPIFARDYETKRDFGHITSKSRTYLPIFTVVVVVVVVVAVLIVVLLYNGGTTLNRTYLFIRYTTNIYQVYFALFTNNIWSYLLWSPVILEYRPSHKRASPTRPGPSRTAVPFWGQTTHIYPKRLFPKRDCNLKRVTNFFTALQTTTTGVSYTKS